MTHGSASLHVMGSRFASEGQLDVNASNALHHLKQELSTCQLQNKKLSDQLNCLVSLIKRSWSGDYHATVHLSNIVGMEPPRSVGTGRPENGSIARPNSQAQFKTKAECNWERFALRLLEREYESVQQEIQEYQYKYIENRQLYMDAVLQDHQQSMSRIPLHRVTDPSVEEVDAKFLRYNRSLQRMGINKPRVPRAQSAGVRRKPSLPEAVEQMEVSLRDLVSDGSSSSHFTTTQERSAPHTIAPSTKPLRRPQSSFHPRQLPNTYNDPARYTQSNLYHLTDNDPVKKPRPVSASSLVQGDIIRSRPRSGYATQSDKPQVFVTQKFERPLKYETTRPVSSKTKTTKQRHGSTGGAVKKVTVNPKAEVLNENNIMNITNPSFNNNGNHQGNSHPVQSDSAENPSSQSHGGNMHDDLRGEEHSDDYEGTSRGNKPPMAVRVKSASSIRRPAFIDEFANDERAMKEMEQDFKKTAVSLQKRLGIEETAIVTYD